MSPFRIRSQSEHPSRAQGTRKSDCQRDKTMKTDDLVAALSTGLEPVDRGLVRRTVIAGLAGGTILALGLMLLGFGIRADLTSARAAMFLLLKLAFAIGIVTVASFYLLRLARPGGERRIS